MNTETLKQTLQVGDKIFTNTLFNWKSPMSYLSKTIRYFTKSAYNHVRVVGLYEGELVYLEALEHGIEVTPIIYNPKREEILVRRNIIPMNVREMFLWNERACNLIGRSYDYWNLTVIQAIYNATGIWVGPNKERKAMKKLICFEYQAYLDKKYLEEEFPGKPWWKFLVKDLIFAKYTYTIYQD